LYSETYRIAKTDVELGINRCRHCGLVYVSPRLSEEIMKYVYNDDAAATISHRYCWNGASDGFRFRGILARLVSLRPEGKLLDVGCGVGQFLAEARRAGPWSVAGLEPSASAAAQARQAAGCIVHSTSLDDAPLEPGSFDVITMFGVLEHLHDPRRALQRVHGLLRPDGVLAVYVPNFQYLRVKDAGPVAWLRTGRWSDLHPQEHMFQFTPRSLRQMLENSGFACLQTEIGSPFLNCRGFRRAVKLAAYHFARGLKTCTGLHLGGIEMAARRKGGTEDERISRRAA